MFAEVTRMRGTDNAEKTIIPVIALLGHLPDAHNVGVNEYHARYATAVRPRQTAKQQHGEGHCQAR